MGSLSLVRQLLAAGLVDRFKLVVCPLVLPQTGVEPTFEGLPDMGFDLLSSRVRMDASCFWNIDRQACRHYAKQSM